MVENYLTLYLLTLYSIFLFISFQFKKYHFWPLWFPFVYYFFKPFFSRLLLSSDTHSLITSIDKFSVVSAGLFPITFFYYYFQLKDKSLIFNTRLSKYILAFTILYFIEIFNPGTTFMSGILSFK